MIVDDMNFLLITLIVCCIALIIVIWKEEFYKPKRTEKLQIVMPIDKFFSEKNNGRR